LIAALLANVALALLVRAQRTPMILTSISALCLLVTLATFFGFTFPANQATNNWTTVPADWQHLRWQWELSHAANAVITFLALCSLTMSLLWTRE